MGKEVSMTLKNSLQETLLNWFVSLKKTAASVRINFSIESCIAFTKKLLPLGTLTA